MASSTSYSESAAAPSPSETLSQMALSAPTATPATRPVSRRESTAWNTVPEFLRKAPKESFVDIPCELYLPGKADPQQWMSTSTVARVTYDGFTYQYGYDPLAQTYDMLVSGLAQSGFVLQETVGVMAAEIPAQLTAGQILRVEAWFEVISQNLYPYEGVGITAMDRNVSPNSSLDSIDMQRLYDDARGFTGPLYLVDHFVAGPHAIDLGQTAVQHFSDRIDNQGWFGIGFAADGWDLSGSDGQTVFWKMAGGGGLPASGRPFFRVYYNAPPAPFFLREPALSSTVLDPQPTLQWNRPPDPNGDTPITFRVRLGTDPALASAVDIDAATAISMQTPFPLAPGSYYWQVVASDPLGAERSSAVWDFTVTTATDAPALGAAEALRAVPNPFNPRTSLRFELAKAGRTTLEIFDGRGRRVRQLYSGELSAGAHTIQWDGRDDRGQSCASGAYFVQLQQGTRHEARRLALVR
jgi:FlgD Ig-like domain